MDGPDRVAVHHRHTYHEGVPARAADIAGRILAHRHLTNNHKPGFGEQSIARCGPALYGALNRDFPKGTSFITPAPSLITMRRLAGRLEKFSSKWLGQTIFNVVTRSALPSPKCRRMSFWDT